MTPTEESQLGTRDASARRRHARLKELFDEFVALDADRRTARLDELCAREPSLGSDLRSLLAAEQAPGPQLEARGALLAVHRAAPEDGAAAHEGGAGSVSSASGSAAGGRFAPGEMVDARYRIVALLGQGGMGEVYRAEDLKLGEQVALKFLPMQVREKESWLERLHAEVRTARQISHPNVVRVHDIGEAEGQAFLSMEYVDGEDLSSLIRRIGALPEPKALEIARQLCAGLGAAHRCGVLHRDLKPANVMIDGKGNAKISDFGLAMFEQEATLDQAGTPAYMAPEQLRDGKSSLASDIYALGLVLYEIFSGERAFAAVPQSEQEAARHHPEDEHLPALSRVPGEVASAIRLCLRGDPKRRPHEVLQVARALPGGDPIAAALAAGETPSPELLRAAPVQGVLSRRLGWALWLVACGLWGFTLFVRTHTTVATVDARQLAPEVLVHEARGLLAEVGWEVPPFARHLIMPSEGFGTLRGEQLTLEQWRQRTENWWSAPLTLRYRAAPTPLVLADLAAPAPDWRPGSVALDLDNRGRLLRFVAIPESSVLPAAQAPTVDWAPLFEAARLEERSFVPVAPRQALATEVDHHVAWRGDLQPGDGAEPLALWVEAASRAGVPVFWQVSTAQQVPGDGVASPVAAALLVLLAMLGLGTWQALRNLRSGRADVRGAAVVTVAFLACESVRHVFEQGAGLLTGFGFFFEQLSLSLLLGVALWVSYVMLEPVIRRSRPRVHVSWARLTSGRLQDPELARNFLLGFAATALLYGALHLEVWLRLHGKGSDLIWGLPHWPGPVGGALFAVANVLHPVVFLVPFGLAFLFFLPALLFPSRTARRATTAAGFLLVIGFAWVWNGFSLYSLAFGVMLALVVYFLGIIGLVGMAAFSLTSVLAPVSLDPALWWAPASWLPLVLVAALLTAAAYSATKSRLAAGHEVGATL